MREIQATAVKNRLPQVLDAVERGETFLITRHGRATARIVPKIERQPTDIDSAIAAIRSLRQRTARITVAELQSARHAGHNY